MVIFIVWNTFILSQLGNMQDTDILEFNQYQKSGKVPFIIYAELEYNNRKDWWI